MTTTFNKGQMGRNIVFNRKSSIAQPSIAQCRNEKRKNRCHTSKLEKNRFRVIFAGVLQPRKL